MVLVGTYSTHVFVKTFMSAWFTLVIMGMVFTSLHIFQELTSKGTKISTYILCCSFPKDYSFSEFW